MCIIYLIKYKDFKKLNDNKKQEFYNDLKRASDYNSDSYGIATSFLNKKKVNIEKFFKQADFLLKVYELLEQDNSNINYILLHCRIATSGNINYNNCHPFFLFNNEVAFCHNGVLDLSINNSNIDYNLLVNDTLILKSIIETSTSKNLIFNREFKNLIETFNILENNKVAFICNKDFIIYNENKGEWIFKNSIWRSNKNHLYNYFNDKLNDYFIEEDKLKLTYNKKKEKENNKTNVIIIENTEQENNIDNK